MAEASEVYELLECPICQERFTEPKVLSCQHTFCLSCLRGYVKDARHFNCPSCRQRHNVPRNGVEAFRDNFFIKNLMEVVAGRSAVDCPDCCVSDQVLGECDHCKEKVCAACRGKHMELSVEIMVQFLSMADKIRSEEDRPGGDGDGSSLVLHSFSSEEEPELMNSLNAEFDKATRAVKERRQALLAEVEDVIEFRRLLSVAREDARSSLQGKMKTCRSVEKLTSLKESFMRLESKRALILKRNPVVKLDAACLRNLGQIYFDDCALEALSNDELERNGKLDKACQTLVDSCDTSVISPNLTSCRLPTSVDYQTKQFAVARRITEHPDVGIEFTPTSAVYCGSKDAIYCISGGQLLCYNMQTLVGTRVCDVENVKHVAVMDSGKVMFSDGKTVSCVTDTSESSRVVHLLNGFNNLIQVCSRGKHFLVLDVGVHNRILRFTEEGKFVREILGKYPDLDKYWSTDGSKMCVDDEGRIYVSDVRITQRKDNGDWKCRCLYYSCPRREYENSKSVKVSWEVVISILTWDGEDSGQLLVDRGSKDYQYKFSKNYCDCPSGLKHYIRDDESIPDDQIIRDNAVRGLCVDGDGYISITRPGKNQVNVRDHDKRIVESPPEPLPEPEVQTEQPPANYRGWFLPCIIVAVALAPIPCLYALAELCRRLRIVEDLRNFWSSDEEKIKENLPKISLALIASCVFAGLVLLELAERWIRLLRWLRNHLSPAPPSAPLVVRVSQVITEEKAEVSKRPLDTDVTILGFNEPKSVAWTPDGKMIVCDKNGINIL